MKILLDLLDTTFLFAFRIHRAWRYYRLLKYTWRLSWAKAGWSDGRLA